jgi:ferredoxin--NADP+ reductase
LEQSKPGAFLRSPVEILGEGSDGPVTGVRVSVNELVDGRAVPTGEEEVIEFGLVLRSIGYRGRPLDGIPWNEQRGLIANEGGRVGRGEYCVGWIKRGPSGVIGTNKKDAADTVARIREDEAAGALGAPAGEAADPDAIAAWLAERVPDAVTWDGWQAIDAAERVAGEPQGRPRVKLVTLEALREAGRLTPTRG